MFLSWKLKFQSLEFEFLSLEFEFQTWKRKILLRGKTFSPKRQIKCPLGQFNFIFSRARAYYLYYKYSLVNGGIGIVKYQIVPIFLSKF